MNYITKLSIETKIKLSLIILLAVFMFSLLMAPKANPDSIFFPLKRIQEKLFLKFKSTPTSQVEYLASILNSRLEELSSMVNNQNHTYVLESSLRYSSTAGMIAQLIQDHKLEDQKSKVIEMFLSHQKALQHLLDIYPKDLDTERKYVEDDLNYLSIYIKQLSSNLSASN